MSRRRGRPPGGGVLVLEGLPSEVAEALRELPGLIGPEQPEAARRRLFPDPSDDEAVCAEWRRTQHPELFALLADAKEIVESDLPSLQFVSPAAVWRLEIPTEHVQAWISALNTARLSLGARHDVVAADLAGDTEPGDDERGRAIERIDLYGWLQGSLIHAGVE